MLHRIPGIIGRLGTAARRNIGTSAGNVVALDSAGKLPAVDGSQLTGISGTGRTKLAADRTYYVRTDGSDSNDGLTNSSGGAFLTIQKAINVVLTLDLGGYAVTIQVGNGTYTAGASVSSPFVGGLVTLQGDTTTPSNVHISVTNGMCIYVGNKASIAIGGFKLSTTTSGYGIYAGSDSFININGKMEYGACASEQIGCFSSVISINADYTISGGSASHIYAADLGVVNDYTRTVTITGTPNFATAFVQAERLANVLCFSNTWSGSATGKRYDANNNAVLYTGGATLPGNSAGTSASGAQVS